MPRDARRVRLFFAARRHACASAMRGRLVPFQALPSEGQFLVGSAAKLPRAQQCCGAPARRNGLRLPRCR